MKRESKYDTTKMQITQSKAIRGKWSALFTDVKRQKQPKGLLTHKLCVCYTQIVFGLKKEENSDSTLQHMNEYWGHYAEWNKSVT